MDDADLGELTAVTISHDGSGSSPAWHLDHIQVTPGCCVRPSSPAAGSNSSSSSPQWLAADGGGQQGAARRASASSPECGVPVLLGTVRQLRKSSSSSRAGSPAPLRHGCRAGVDGAAYLFPCNAWLDETLGGGLTKRRLPVARWAADGVSAAQCLGKQAASGLAVYCMA